MPLQGTKKWNQWEFFLNFFSVCMLFQCLDCELILIALHLQALMSVMCNAHHTLLVNKQLQLILETPADFFAQHMESPDSELLS